MEDRTCPFCGGRQSGSRCEICGRSTVKIQQAGYVAVRPAHPYQEQHLPKEKGRTDRAMAHPYRKDRFEKRIVQERQQKAQRQKQVDRAMHVANATSIITFLIILAVILFLAF